MNANLLKNIVVIGLFAACANTRDTKNAPRVNPAVNTGTNTGYNTGAMNTNSDMNANSDTDTGMNSGANDNTGTAMNTGSASPMTSNGSNPTNTAMNDQKAYVPGTPYTHGSFTITDVSDDSMLIKVGKKTIYVNPGAKITADSTKADMILFTDMPEETVTDTWLGEIKTQTAVIYAPQAVSDKYPSSKMKVIADGKKETWTPDDTVGPITIEAPNGQGYVISADNDRVYVSGDKECFAKVTTVKSLGTPVLSVGKTTVSVPNNSEEKVITCLKAK